MTNPPPVQTSATPKRTEFAVAKRQNPLIQDTKFCSFGSARELTAAPDGPPVAIRLAAPEPVPADSPTIPRV